MPITSSKPGGNDVPKQDVPKQDVPKQPSFLEDTSFVIQEMSSFAMDTMFFFPKLVLEQVGIQDKQPLQQSEKTDDNHHYLKQHPTLNTQASSQTSGHPETHHQPSSSNNNRKIRSADCGEMSQAASAHRSREINTLPRRVS